jgi:hypothetical protein
MVSLGKSAINAKILANLIRASLVDSAVDKASISTAFVLLRKTGDIVSWNAETLVRKILVRTEAPVGKVPTVRRFSASVGPDIEGINAKLWRIRADRTLVFTVDSVWVSSLDTSVVVPTVVTEDIVKNQPTASKNSHIWLFLLSTPPLTT